MNETNGPENKAKFGDNSGKRLDYEHRETTTTESTTTTGGAAADGEKQAQPNQSGDGADAPAAE